MTPIHLSDLLQRRERILDSRPVRSWLKGRSVAVTGVGYIGSELARQIMSYEPASLLCIDNSETSLWNVSQDLGDSVDTVYGDVRDAARMFWLLHKTEIVFHSAAMKHVPICERASMEAARTNVEGTKNIIRATRGRLVLVSTDKAVRPTSVMGHTKMLAERAMGETGRASVVRFGNVIGSTGSVVQVFERQIKRGGPVTVTDPAMTRYFMTVGEAAELILQAGAAGPGVYVLDMGEPVSIDGLARDMIRLSGRRDIQVVYSGMRAGEKLHEELSDAPLTPSGIDGIYRVEEAI